MAICFPGVLINGQRLHAGFVVRLRLVLDDTELGLDLDLTMRERERTIHATLRYPISCPSVPVGGGTVAMRYWFYIEPVRPAPETDTGSLGCEARDVASLTESHSKL